MPQPKSKGTSKAKEPESKAKEPEKEPRTVNERSRRVFYQTNPTAKRIDEVGVLGLSPAEQQTWANAQILPRVASRKTVLSPKVEREYWKQLGKDNVPARSLQKAYSWGKDRQGRDVGDYSLEEFATRRKREERLVVLNLESERFRARRELARRGLADRKGKKVVLSEEETDKERKRRREIEAIKKELYGGKMSRYVSDPLWDDVVPIPADEPDGALAAIAYPDDYVEAMSYLRAVMAANECTQRALDLTDHIISMNPAHYTVWLFRFKIISTMDLSIPSEIDWLNDIALAHLKNYQIWHHRHLLMEHYYPKIADDKEAVSKLAKSETQFITQMLSADTKNYHVWSYRSYLVRKLGMFNLQELLSTQNLIEDDVRNNSAWSHRFFVVFSDPKASTEGKHSTEYDEKVPAETIDREVKYTLEKITMAPQNQAAWNYLRGVMVKGGRKMGTVKEFCEGFVTDLGDVEKEDVKSTHALDALADAYAEEGDKEKAKLCLARLAEKWDPIRSGYWKYREQMIDAKE